MYKSLLKITIICLLAFSGHYASGQKTDPAIIKDILKETNQLRKSNGKKELVLNEQLNQIAGEHSADMAAGRVAFSHDGYNERVEKAKKGLNHVKGFFAENVAFGQKTAYHLVKDWKNSPGHLTNMLGNYTYIGIGVATDKNGRLYYTQLFAR
ncbi:MAG: CAP domain-containing protein [Ginsengibacter sp.]